jgi:hypothetical protein
VGLIPDELKTRYFPCPNCGQTLTDEVETCKYCSFEISEDVRNYEIAQEVKRNKDARLRGHKNVMIVGAVFFVAGLGMIGMTLMDVALQERSINFSCFTPFVLIGGLGAIIKGCVDYRREKRDS